MSRSVRARIDLYQTDSGGLALPLGSRTRSLLFGFVGSDGVPMTIGGEVRSALGDLKPGAVGLQVVIDFWAEEASRLVRPSTEFTIWYNRTVGRGEVLEIVSD